MLKITFIILILSSLLSALTVEEAEIYAKNTLLSDGYDSVDVSLYSSKKVLEKYAHEMPLIVSRESHGNKNTQRTSFRFANDEETLSFSVTLYKNLPVASVPIKKGDVITMESVTMLLTDVTNRENIAERASEVYGSMAKKNFKVGELFQHASLKEAPLVIKDMPVTVMVKKSSINLSFETVAFSSGYEGEKVYFRNPFNKELQLGVVIGKKLVKF